MDLDKLLEQQRRYTKLMEDALGPVEAVRRQVEQLAGPSLLNETIRRMMADVEEGLYQRTLREQIERITTLGLPVTGQLEVLKQLQLHAGAVESAK